MRTIDRKLVLEDGSEYYGYGFGSRADRVCEIVFNTSMSGYQEIVSDLSYTDQMVVMTYPLIGNYGMAEDDYECKFPSIGGIVHTHSPYAVAWAQAGEDLPCYGTTHADYFYGSVPCARHLTQAELDEDYERNTGITIVETFRERGIDPKAVPAVLCHSHGPFTWGKDADQAVYHSVVLEECAKMGIFTRVLNPHAAPAPQRMLDKHYLRKHGPNAYYGQKK